jgi:hypothetical protein
MTWNSSTRSKSSSKENVSSSKTLTSEVTRDVITCRELKYRFDSDSHCLLSVDCSLQDKGKILWISSSPEKVIAYSKDDTDEMSIDKLIPHSFQAEHTRCFNEYLNTGVSEKIFKKTQTVVLRSDGLGQMTDMWMKPYIHLSPFKPVLLALNRKVVNNGSFFCVTDGYGYVDCVSQEYKAMFSPRFPFNEQVSSIFYYAPDLLTYFLENSQNFKGRLPPEEMILDKSSTRISKNPSILNEAMIKLEWFGIEKQNSDPDFPSLNRKLWDGPSFNLHHIVSKIRSIPRSNKEVYSVKIKIIHQHLKNGTTMFFIHLNSFSDKRLEMAANIDSGKRNQEELVKMDSIDAQIQIKNEEEGKIPDQNSDVKEVKFSSCVNVSHAKADSERKTSKNISVNNIGPSNPKAIAMVKDRFRLIKNLVTIAHIIRSGEKISSSVKLDSKDTNPLTRDKTTGYKAEDNSDGNQYDIGLAQIQNQKRRKLPFMSVFWREAVLLLSMSGITGVFLIVSVFIFSIVF